MRQGANAFDGLRLAAAFLVLFSHCYPLTGQSQAEPLALLTGGLVGFGELAVHVFFAISGYLVTLSWMKDPHPWRFLARRCLRIMPALVLLVLASMALLGPAFSQHDASVYFGHADAWSYLAKILIYPAQHGLPGVFLDNPYAGIVNGSLWTLRLEFGLYLIFAVAGSLGLLQLPGAAMALALATLSLGLVVTSPGGATMLPFSSQLTVLSLNAVPFFLGAALARSGAGNAGTARAMAFMAMAALPLAYLGAGKFYFVLLLPFAALLLANAFSCDLSRRGDYSYGVYLWAFPVQQSLVALFPEIAPIPLFGCAALLTLGCAVLSWHLVERPALRLKPVQRIATY